MHGRSLQHKQAFFGDVRKRAGNRGEGGAAFSAGIVAVPGVNAVDEIPVSPTDRTMANILLVILLIICVILTGLILIQRSEGGALGIGGGGGGGGFMSGRGTADLVTRLTTFFGAAFMIVCLMISISFNYENRNRSLLDAENAEQGILADEKTENDPLNPGPDSAKDTAPLVEDSVPVESTPETGKARQGE